MVFSTNLRIIADFGLSARETDALRLAASDTPLADEFAPAVKPAPTGAVTATRVSPAAPHAPIASPS